MRVVKLSSDITIKYHMYVDNRIACLNFATYNIYGSETYLSPWFNSVHYSIEF